MHCAESIALRLLEAYESFAPRGSVYVLSGEDGGLYNNFAQYARLMLHKDRLTDAEIASLIDSQIGEGVVFVYQPDYGKLVIYSKDYPVPVTTDQFTQMGMKFHVTYGETVGWSSRVNQRPKAAALRDVFGALKAMDHQAKEKEKLEKEAGKLEKEVSKEHGSYFDPKQDAIKALVALGVGQKNAAELVALADEKFPPSGTRTAADYVNYILRHQHPPVTS